MKSLYIVTVTPKFPTWNHQAYTLEILAGSKTEANKRARREQEAAGHYFGQSEACTFSAREATPEEVRAHNLLNSSDDF